MDASRAMRGARREEVDTSDASSVLRPTALADEITFGGPLLPTAVPPRRRSLLKPDGEDFFSSELDRESKDDARFDIFLLRQDPFDDLDLIDPSSASIMASQVGCSAADEFSTCATSSGWSFGFCRFEGENDNVVRFGNGTLM